MTKYRLLCAICQTVFNNRVQGGNLDHSDWKDNLRFALRLCSGWWDCWTVWISVLVILYFVIAQRTWWFVLIGACLLKFCEADRRDFIWVSVAKIKSRILCDLCLPRRFGKSYGASWAERAVSFLDLSVLSPICSVLIAYWNPLRLAVKYFPSAKYLITHHNYLRFCSGW